MNYSYSKYIFSITVFLNKTFIYSERYWEPSTTQALTSSLVVAGLATAIVKHYINSKMYYTYN